MPESQHVKRVECDGCLAAARPLGISPLGRGSCTLRVTLCSSLLQLKRPCASQSRTWTDTGGAACIHTCLVRYAAARMPMPRTIEKGLLDTAFGA